MLVTMTIAILDRTCSVPTYSIVLLDEIEKADPRDHLLLQFWTMVVWQMVKEYVNFKNTVIIATSNAGFGRITDRRWIQSHGLFDLTSVQSFATVSMLSSNSRLEQGRPLRLLIGWLVDVNNVLRKNDLAVSDAAKEYMTEEGYDEGMGVRPPVG